MMTDVVEDPEFPDLIGVEGGPMIPCRVVEFSAATVARVEGDDGAPPRYEQVQRYVIRYRPKPVEVSYMTGATAEEIKQAKQAVLETAVALYDEQQPAPGRVATVCVGQQFSAEHRYVLRAYREAHGKPTVTAGMPTAVEVNGAVTWWNQRQETQDG